MRVIGDRGSIFEADPNTRAWFEYLARNGVPIRLRYHPTWFPFIIHWKCGIFKGQRTVEFGSANWTTDELVRFSPTNFKDETALFSSDLTLVNAFLTKFDQYWADTTDFLDWKDAYLAETGQQWTAPYPAINRTRREPDGRDAPGMVWSQGDELTSAMLAEINRETQAIDFVIYRLTIPSITDALIAKHRAGVTVRVIVEPTQYRNRLYPEYEMTGANIDRLWAAGIPIKQRQHEGLTHMKTLITSNIALNASSNFTANWERDHNYFIPAQTKPALHAAFKNRFNAMWNDGTNFVQFQPQNPAPAPLLTPAISASNVPTTTKLEWNRAFWATSYDVYFGTSSGNPPLVARVNAVVSGDPPQTYSWTPPQPLLPNTAYYWKVVSRTFATDVNAAITATSEFWGFTTAGSGSGGSTPFGSGPVALPGTIQAENFDNGGANVAYIDTSSGNSGGAYRTTDVDVEATTDTGGGNNVGWIATGEWLKYSVNVSTAGAYTLEFRVASSGGGGTFHVDAGTQNISGPISIPNTGGWQTWTTVTKTGVNLTAGPQVWTVRFDAVGTGGAIGNLNWIRVTSGGTPPPPPPPPALPTLPGTLQAEDFDTGAQNVAYLDNSPGNTGGQYRTTDVDIEGTSDTGGGYNVGWGFAGEWLRYTVNVTTAGTYDIEFRVASGGGGGTFHVSIGGVNKTGTLTVPNTGGWQTWTTVRATGVTLAAGQQVWQLVLATNGATTAVGNFNWIRVVAAGSSPPPPPPPPPVAAPEIVIYGSDVTNANLHGNWSKVSDATAAGNTRVASADRAGPTVSTPFAAPVDYFEATFNAVRGVRYRLWLRHARCRPDNKFNERSGSNSQEAPMRVETSYIASAPTQALMSTCDIAATAACLGLGLAESPGSWENRPSRDLVRRTAHIRFACKSREDGVSIDQIVLSPQRFVDSAPGPPTGDNTIVQK